MMDLDEYAGTAAPASVTYQSTSAFDMPLLSSHGPSGAGPRSQAVPGMHQSRLPRLSPCRQPRLFERRSPSM
jgi:hypothetical protein